MVTHKNMFTRFIIIILLVMSCLSVNSVSAAIMTPQVVSKAALVADLHTGQVIADKNGSERLPIASISKLLVIYMIEQAVQDKKINHNDVVTIPPDIATFSQDTSVVNIPLNTTQHYYTVQQLEEASLLASSNSAAMALANLVAGNQNNYYKKAEDLLTSWNIKNTRIYSSSGLKDGDLDAFNNRDTDDNQENRLSAREVAIIAKKLIDKFPNVLSITSKVSTSFPTDTGENQTITNTNKLLTDSTTYNFTGLKTGVTPNDGGNFVGITKIANEPVITVTLNSGTDDYTKFTDTTNMLNQVSSTTKITPINDKLKRNLVSADTKNGVITLTPKIDYNVFSSKNSEMKLTTKIKYNSIKLPLKKSKVTATQQLLLKDQAIDDYLLKTPTIKYVPTKNIKEANIFVIIYRNFLNLFK